MKRGKKIVLTCQKYSFQFNLIRVLLLQGKQCVNLESAVLSFLVAEACAEKIVLDQNRICHCHLLMKHCNCHSVFPRIKERDWCYFPASYRTQRSVTCRKWHFIN